MSTPGRHRTEPEPVRRSLADRVHARFALRLSRRRAAVLGLACVLLVAGALVALLLPGGTGRRPPTPPAPVAGGRAPTSSGAAGTVGMPSLTRAFRCRAAEASSSGGGGRPQRICIPQIRVDASVMRLGLNRDRTVQVPPLSQVGDAGWYRYSALPGAVGPTVILGHVDSAQYGDGVFFELGRLHQGDTVSVLRSDGRTATFVVTRVDEVSKKRFPTDEVYGPTSGPALRLVTCGGRFDASIGSYEDNIIVYATLRSLH